MNIKHSGSGSFVNKSAPAFNSVQVFSATLMKDRGQLGDEVTEWIQDNPSFQISEISVTQSSDEAFHCLSMVVFYYDPAAATAK